MNMRADDAMTGWTGRSAPCKVQQGGLYQEWRYIFESESGALDNAFLQSFSNAVKSAVDGPDS